MANVARILSVMIASPGDVMREREIARDVIHGWNYVNTQSSSVVLMPMGWETHSAPEIGTVTAQDLINTRILRHCDLLIGIFWTRLGTPTTNADSGTAEEIQRHIAEDKPALVYFSNAPIDPRKIDSDQYKSLMKFKSWCQQRGLTESFSDAEEFRNHLTRHLTITINQNPKLKELLRSSQVNTAQLGRDIVLTKISERAWRLLTSASQDPNATVSRYMTRNGSQISSNQVNFIDENDVRSEILWEDALVELEKHGFVHDVGQMRELFKVTSKGFLASEDKSATDSPR